MVDLERLKVLADSYLDHILIIAEVQDKGANLRDFVDPWWSLTRGPPFVKEAVNPSQHTLNNPCACGCEHQFRLRALDWISAGALDALARGACKKKMKRGRDDLRDPSDRLIVDHAVPLAQIYSLLFQPGRNWSRDSLRTMLAHHLKRGLLTKVEDKQLDVQGLNSAMPAGWEEGGDPFARYRAAGIHQAVVR